MDKEIKKEFDRCEAAGLCRSDVAGLRMKWMKGNKHMIAQYHPTWQLVKRKAFFTKPSMKEPFSHEAFNFTKVSEPEVLKRIKVVNNVVVEASDDTTPASGVIYTALVNVSPICNNHYLLVPNLVSCYPQIWRDECTSDLLVMCNTSYRDDFVIFFNSLGGFSSVNHLHFQVMYTRSFYETASGTAEPPLSASFEPNKLPLEYAESTLLCKKGSVCVGDVKNWLSQTIVLSVEKSENEAEDEKRRRELAERVNTVIHMCYEYNYPYDVIMCNYGYTVYIFIRQYQQPITDLCVNPACVELTGIVVYRSEETFNHADQDRLMEACQRLVYLRNEEWSSFTSAMVNRIMND